MPLRFWLQGRNTMADGRTSRHLTECVLAGIPVKNGKIQRHPYQRDSQSGAGNCVCGRDYVHTIHAAGEEA
ncbi:hypothetical protein GUMBIE_76 [Mycobacterium phage GUmbie]|uniref:Uncharacterized protein n=1 Tax=Mycobacterium phage GUmbie TaxID=2922991 RepID=G1JTM2_9CAUD|nr:hypothetical protein CL77_gp076 [Mycobacterium phage GUmbie]AEL20065.1 hypothetical protein GUMBIE_76 [Mycobacterium phage GUmbie]